MRRNLRDAIDAVRAVGLQVEEMRECSCYTALHLRGGAILHLSRGGRHVDPNIAKILRDRSRKIAREQDGRAL
jgi:hypothetical protein